MPYHCMRANPKKIQGKLMRAKHSNAFILFLSTLIILVLIPLPGHSAPRIIGSLGIEGYGYQDEIGEDHLWLFQNTSLSVYCQKLPLSLHFSGGFIGDQSDDFGSSAQLRFLKGYLQAGNQWSSHYLRAGRFFVHRGVALGVLDGIDAGYQFAPFARLTAFAGMSGPVSRKFEWSDPEKSFSSGGELTLLSNQIPFIQKGSLGISYAYWTRDNEKEVHRYGFTGLARINDHWNASGILHIRPKGNNLRRAALRVRYSSNRMLAMIEGSALTPDVADYSWFRDFKMGIYTRLRSSALIWTVPNKWAGGVDVTGLLTDGANGWRFGPMIHSPWGQAGYRLSVGDHARSEGPWINAQYMVVQGLEARAQWSMTTYQWDYFDIESEDLTSLLVGANWTPEFFNSITLSAEYQIYTSPQFDSDKRALVGVVWQFDNGAN